MAFDAFSHHEIAAVLQDEKDTFQPFLLDLAFGSQMNFDGMTQIDFDKIDPDRRMSVFTSPRVQGKVQKERGFAVRSYKPGYIKEKETVDFDNLIKRRAGEAYNSGMTASQRYAVTMTAKAQKMRERKARRLEWMASQFLLNGKYNMVGEGLDVEVDFGRLTNRTWVRSGVNAWDGSSAAPMDDMQKMLAAIQAPVRNIVMGNGAFYAYLNASLEKDKVPFALRTEYAAQNPAFWGNSTIQTGVTQGWYKSVMYRGMINTAGVSVWTYAGTYEDPENNNVETKFIPDDAVLFIPDASEGIRCYAAIQDAAANYAAMEEFWKNWIEEDPGVPYIMMQSAPMLAHTLIQSTACIRTGVSASIMTMT